MGVRTVQLLNAHDRDKGRTGTGNRRPLLSTETESAAAGWGRGWGVVALTWALALGWLLGSGESCRLVLPVFLWVGSVVNPGSQDHRSSTHTLSHRAHRRISDWRSIKLLKRLGGSSNYSPFE